MRFFETPPDLRWLPFLKMFFGFLLLLMLAILAGAIALGKVEQHTSYGLEGIIGGLTALSGGFVNWAFTVTKDDMPTSGSKNESSGVKLSN